MIFEQAEKLPPFVCRLVARKRNGHAPMSTEDIAIASGISKSYVSTLSRKTTWKGVGIEVVDQFARACGVDFLKPHETVEVIRKGKMIFTKNCSVTQKRFFAKLFQLKPSTN